METKNLLFGKNSITDAIDNDLKITKIITTNKDLINQFKSYKVEIVSKNFFQKYNDVNHQFIAAEVIQKINHLSIDELISKLSKKDNSIILMLDNIEDPGNFGAIIRSAVAFGVDAIIYKNTNQAQINERVIKTSTGGVYYIDFVKVANLSNTLNKLKDSNWWSYAAALEEKSISLKETKFDKKSVIIVGNEHDGISKIVKSNSDFIVKIDMSNKLQSLNVSVATGIILSKIFTQ
ncbi:MAG: 23S rRNA (guanosine(2251)-2'-O)-methyltransferase RlmB [Mycoplasma sp.]